MYKLIGENQELLDAFTMGGKVELYEPHHIEDHSDRHTACYAQEDIKKAFDLIARRKNGHYGDVDQWLYSALTEFPIAKKRVAVIGSKNQSFGPWYETVAIAYGASEVVVSELKPIQYEDSRFSSVTNDQLGEVEKFDAVISVSTFEHCGLARYGDELDPDGDIKALDEIRNILKPDGIMYMGVPLGKDKIVGNFHRTYGKHRFPKLFENWETISHFGFEEELLERDTGCGWNQPRIMKSLGIGYPEYSPIFVIKPK